MKRLRNISWLMAGILLVMVFALAACTPAQPQATDAPSMDSMDSGSDHTMEHDHNDGADPRVANNGAVVKLLSPTDGATFNKDEDVVVEIQTENFDLNAEGNHWHLYVDGSVWTMVENGGTKFVLHGLDAGEHHLEVYLGLPTHEELEDGASAMITVNE